MSAEVTVSRWRLGVDIGGTFTDVVLWSDTSGVPLVKKVLTTPDDPARGVLDGVIAILGEGSVAAPTLSQVIHATTLPGNAVIQRKGAKTALITSKGFRDILEIGREKAYDIYDLFLDLPAALIPRRLRYEVDERTLYNGDVLVPVKGDEIRGLATTLRREAVESVAVCFLHSFRNPECERQTGKYLAEALPGLSISLSSEVLPEIREYERFSTTAINAFVRPVVSGYLRRLERGLESLGAPRNLTIMLSNGGITSAGVAGHLPVRLIESGPAAGALVAAHFARAAGIEDVISFDMGGTTAKICLIKGGKPSVTRGAEVGRVYRFKRGSGLPVKVPMIEMIEIGAGGGSLARVDDLGMLQVGPESAGADPGPACYGLGGKTPTVTDADLLLGYLDPERFAAGAMPLDTDQAREAVRRWVADPLGFDEVEAAWAIHRIVNETMVNAVLTHCAEKGEDPRGYALVAFGGAGPAHAYRVGVGIRAPRIICPPAAGVASAVGLLVAPPLFDCVRSYMTPLEAIDFRHLRDLFREMEAEALEVLDGMGLGQTGLQISRSCEMRYRGQGFEVEVLLPDGTLQSSAIPAIRAAFEQEYRRLYRRAGPDRPLEILTWRVRVTAKIPPPAFSWLRRPASSVAGEPHGERQAFFPEAGGFITCPVHNRRRLGKGWYGEGPLLIEEPETTTVVGPGGSCHIDSAGNLVISLAQGS